jgi:hypothetical protein
MAYRPVGEHNLQPAHFDNIELNTDYDPGVYNYAPPPGKPPSHTPDGDSKQDDDTKPFFRATSQPAPPPGANWPIQSQQVATVTPLRALLMVFDGVLASMPIMFVGEFIQVSQKKQRCIFDPPLHDSIHLPLQQHRSSQY